MKLIKLALVMEQDHISAAVWEFGLKGWKISRSERVALPTADPLAEQVLAAIRPLAVSWGIAPDTPVMVVVPAGVGGVLSFTFAKSARKDLDALLDFELTKALPFSLKEIERGYHAATVGEHLNVGVVWLPRLWLVELKNALARAGLRLSELFHRAQLMGVALGREQAAAPWGCVEQDGPAVHFHYFRSGVFPDRSRCLCQAEAATLGREFELEWVALDSAGMSPSPVYLLGVEPALRETLEKPHIGQLQVREAKPDLPELLLSLWNGGGKGVWLMPDKGDMTDKLTPYLIGLAALGVLVSVAAWWVSSQQGEAVVVLEDEIKHLKPRYLKAVALEREVVAAQQEIDGIGAAVDGPSPLEPFYEIFKALPETAWLLSFNYAQDQISIEGYGVEDKVLSEKLSHSGQFKDIAPVEPQLAKNAEAVPFALKMKWSKSAKPSPAKAAAPAAGQSAPPVSSAPPTKPSPSSSAANPGSLK